MIRWAVTAIALGIFLESAASAQAHAPFTRERATKLTPGFNQKCAAEIAAAYSRAGFYTLPVAGKLRSLDQYVGQPRSFVQTIYNNQLRGVGSAVNDEIWRSVYAYKICVFGYMLAHWDDAGSKASPPSRAASPSRSRMASQPAPVAANADARDKAEEAALIKEVQALIARYTLILPCQWRNDGTKIESPCLKNNFQKGVYISNAMLNSVEKRRHRLSPEKYSSTKKHFEGLRDHNLKGCADLAARTTTPCVLSGAGRAAAYKPDLPQKAASNEVRTASSAPMAARSRIIAGDGKSAMHCVSIKQLASGNSALTGGGKVILNGCGEPVEATWCYVNGDCNTTGAQVTLQANRSWPIDGTKEVRFAACLGKGTVRFEDGSKGLRYVCTAPR